MREIMNLNWIKSTIVGAIGIVLLLTGSVLYAGIAIGIRIRDYFLTFKSQYTVFKAAPAAYFFIVMSKIEDLLYSAEEHGKRYKMFDELEKIKTSNPKLSLEQQYEKAYQIAMNT